jgi:hypothetical protein
MHNKMPIYSIHVHHQYQSCLCRIKRRFQYFALHRTQWVGLDGAPTNVALNTPLNESNLGLGVTIINDKIGPTTENTISTDVSYTVPTENFKLFGIKATANF